MIALRVYRMLPKEHRLRMLQVLPPQRQLWLVRRLTRISSRGTSVPVGKLRTARDGAAQVQARVVAAATPADRWRHNLDLVTAAFDEAGVPHFAVPTLDERRSAVAVREQDRDGALRALATVGAQDGVTVRLPDRARPGRSVGVAEVFAAVTDPFGRTVLGQAFACDVEFWPDAPTEEYPVPHIAAPRPNRIAAALPTVGATVAVPGRRLSRFAGEDTTYPSRAEFAGLAHDQVTFPIDVVYTWVDGDDGDWRERKNRALREHGAAEMNEVAANDARYVSRDELRYSMRSLVAYAPWVRQIYLVTDDQVPAWLDVTHPMVRVVRHREIFADTGRLPTFNSHAIESRLHRIPGLSEHFVYVNDDMFFGRPLVPTAFFHANGIAKFFTSPAQLDVGPATVHDAPVTAAGKNNRRHIEERFGRTISQKMRHVPYPLRRSVLEEIERHLPAEVLATAEHQFRHPGDLSIPSSLQHYWSYLSGTSVPGSIRYTYADLAHPSTPVKLAALLSRRHCDVFCLNDTDSSEVLLSEQQAMLADFLSAYLPFRAPFEVSPEVEAQRLGRTASALAAELLPESPTSAAPRQGTGRAPHDPAGQPEPVR
ncbi:stealth family protein [Micromonospora musae]|uniref:stealth family protein n=1 Tax=Micromonospora musae TaxID=1894970 RepID=UPI001F30EE69|nr:stealth family protein [Micromonospora musae]